MGSYTSYYDDPLLDLFQQELGVSDSYDVPVSVPVTVPVVSVAPLSTLRYRSASVPRHVGGTGYHHHRASVPVSPVPIRRYYPAVPKSPTLPRRHLHSYLGVEDEYVPRYGGHSRPPVSYSSLRARTVDARNKLDTHRSMLDRYLPVPMGPHNEVEYEVEYKYGELAARMPSLEPYRATRGGVGSSMGHIAPYKPARSASHGGGGSGYGGVELRHRPPRPKMSDTRKKAREVLCRTKGDPNYFSY